MAIDFPNSPSTNDLHSSSGKTWKWDGEKWIVIYTDLSGPVGPTGPTGPTGSTGATGATGINFLGSWNSSTEYFLGDVVTYAGSSWYMSSPSSGGTNYVPGDSFRWTLLASAGADGAAGAAGANGIDGATGPEGPTGPTGANGATGATGPAATWSDPQTITSKTTNYTLASADAGTFIQANSASAITLTVSTSTALSAGQSINIMRYGSGTVAVAASSTTIYSTPGLNLRAQYSVATLLCVSSNTYVLFGDLS